MTQFLTKLAEQCLEQCSSFSDDSYKHFIVFSSDTLLVITKDHQLVEWILCGSDNDALIVETASEDEFLDAIMDIKSAILSGDNPKITLVNS